jgi:hypothetical protein
MEGMNKRVAPLIAKITLGFVVLVPLYTYLLLAIKGLPDFANSHQVEVVTWLFQSTWLAALASGLVVSVAVSVIVSQTPYFHDPFDFGRCFSLGAVLGALAEAPATYLVRALSHRPYSDFWMAGAMMAGFLAGGTLIPLLLRKRGLPI